MYLLDISVDKKNLRGLERNEYIEEYDKLKYQPKLTIESTQALALFTGLSSWPCLITSYSSIPANCHA